MSQGRDSGSTLTLADFEPVLEELLPETCAVLSAARLTVHPSVTHVVLHGSRGLARRWRADSDIDLTLVADRPAEHSSSDLERAMRETLAMARGNWSGGVEVDLAVVFDVRGCGLHCFESREWRADLCSIGGQDCFGLYKEQRGYGGLVTNAGVEVRRMFPCLVVWRRSQAQR